MKLFPHILVRIGGGAFSKLERMNFASLIERSDEFTTLKQHKEKQKNLLCEDLLNFNRTLTDSKIQNKIQNIRRDIFNDRIKPAIAQEIKLLLSEPLQDQLEAYLNILNQLDAMAEDTRGMYQEEISRARKYLQTLSTDENLLKGLVLSSQTFLNSIYDFQKKDPDNFRNKEFQTEYSLLKYLTRMYAKTSPFSTFNNLALGKSDPSQEAPILAKSLDSKKDITGHIRLNNYIFKYLKDLFANYRDFYTQLPLRANSTIETCMKESFTNKNENYQQVPDDRSDTIRSSEENNGDHFLYLTNHDNTEAFQRLPANSVIPLILQIVQKDKSGIRFSDLIKEVMEYIDASEEEIESYLKQLVDYGLLEYNLEVSGIDPDWDLKLVKRLHFLKLNEISHIDELIRVLSYIRELASQYGVGNVQQRKEFLNLGFDALKAVCMKIHEAAGLSPEERKSQDELLAENRKKAKANQENKKTEKPEDEVAVAEQNPEKTDADKEEIFSHKSSTYFAFKPEQIFYEDTTREIAVNFNHEALFSFIQKIDEAYKYLGFFEGYFDERAKMKHYMKEKFGSNSSIKLLSFYENYYRDVKKPEAELQAKKKKEALEKDKNKEEVPVDLPGKEISPIPAIQKRSDIASEWKEKLTAKVVSSNAETDSINVSLKDLKEISSLVDFTINNTSSASSGIFVQMFEEKDALGKPLLKGVVNNFFPGYGKMMSRFLHIFDTSVTEEVRNWNEKIMEEDIFIEDCDASYFNANLHPPLLPYEVRIPGGHNSLPVEQQLPITDFDVQYDEDEDVIKLNYRPTSKRAYVFDLGFQGQGGRSQLFQLLEKFSKIDYLSLSPITHTINSKVVKVNFKPDSEMKIKYFPRIVFDDQIIIQRKSWEVLKDSIPVCKPGMHDADYYVLLNEWRKGLNIPDEVFIYINSRSVNKDADPKLFQKLSRDDYKPQYINFQNPLLVNLFQRLITKIPLYMRLEEMLPNSKQLLKVNEEKFVTEYMVQWYGEGIKE